MTVKKALVCSVFMVLCCIPVFAGEATVIGKNDSEFVLRSTIDPAKPAKPAYFPHAAHQARLECKTCHHSRTAEGKRLSYAEGQTIAKCESCHNSKTNMQERIATFKNAAHTLCQGCHRKNNPDLVKCIVCHKT